MDLVDVGAWLGARCEYQESDVFFLIVFSDSS